MSQYETVCIVSPDFAAGKVDKIKEKVKKIIGEGKGEVILEKDWGTRKLAYTIGKSTHGHYLYFNYSGTGQFIIDLERQLKYEEGVIRFLTVRLPENVASGKSKKVTDAEEGRFVFDFDFKPERSFSRGGDDAEEI